MTVEQATAKILWSLIALRLAQETMEVEAFDQCLTSQELDKLENQVYGVLTEVCPDIIRIWEEAEAQAGRVVVEAMIILDKEGETEKETISYVLKKLMETYLQIIGSFSEILGEEIDLCIQTLQLKFQDNPRVWINRVDNLICQVAWTMNRSLTDTRLRN